MKNRFNSDDNLPLKKLLKHDNIVIVIGSSFRECNKYYQQEHERIDVKKSTSVLSVITGTFLKQILDFSQKYVMFSLMK